MIASAILAVGMLVASPAEAGGGGGGTKGRNGTIRILGGQTGGGVGVIPLAGTTAPPAGGYPSVAALQAAGGAVINPGQVLQFKVAGPGNAVVGPIDGTGAFPLATGVAAYSGAQNRTGYLQIGGTNLLPTIAGTGNKF